MALRKCPRCELNYILDDGALCVVCREEVCGKRPKEEVVTLCSACGEAAALPGDDMCADCLKAIRYVDILSTDEEEDAQAAELEPEPISALDEIEGVELPDSVVEAEEEEPEESAEE